MDWTQEDRSVLEALEESLWRGNARYDVTLMEKTFAPDCAEIGCSGRFYTRADLLFPPDGGTNIDAVLPLPGYVVFLVAPGVALATYTSVVTHDGTVERARRSSLWVWLDGRWRLRFHQGTPC